MKNKIFVSEKLDMIFEDRLKLQSIRRYLDYYNLPYKLSFFKSDEFIKNHYNNWTVIQRKNFLVKVVGQFYWKKMKDMLETIG